MGQLNSAYIQMENQDNNFAAKVFDYKQCGSWLSASDGPEVMGRGSLLQYLNILTADDSIKMAVTDLQFEHVTIFQGNAGGAANIGSYGKTREMGTGDETTNMWVDGLYAHRVLQKDEGFDGLGGLIVSRNGCFGSKITSSGIVNVHVPSLGGCFDDGQGGCSSDGTGGRLGPNVVYRLFSLGFACCSDHSSSQCPFASDSPQPDQYYENLYFKAWNNYVNPLDNNLFYDRGVDQISVKGWMKPIEVYDMADPDNQEQFVRTFSGQVDGEPDFWYAVNGFAPQQAPECASKGVNSCLFTGCSVSPACNVEYVGETDVDLKFPTH